MDSDSDNSEAPSISPLNINDSNVSGFNTDDFAFDMMANKLKVFDMKEEIYTDTESIASDKSKILKEYLPNSIPSPISKVPSSPKSDVSKSIYIPESNSPRSISAKSATEQNFPYIDSKEDTKSNKDDDRDDSNIDLNFFNNRVSTESLEVVDDVDDKSVKITKDEVEDRFLSISFDNDLDKNKNQTNLPIKINNFPPINNQAELEEDRKIELLYRLDEYRREGYVMKNKFNLDTSLKELEFEVTRIEKNDAHKKKIRRRKKNTEFSNQMFIMAVTGLELLSSSMKAFPLELEGFSDNVKLDISDGKYTDVFEELSDKYTGERSPSPPEVRFLITFITSAVMFHMSKSLTNLFSGSIGKPPTRRPQPTRNPNTPQPTRNPNTPQPTRNPNTSQPTRNPNTPQPTRNPKRHQPTSTAKVIRPPTGYGNLAEQINSKFGN